MQSFLCACVRKTGFMAYNVMKSLSSVAHNTGRTVITTIHQPRSNIFEVFKDFLWIQFFESLRSKKVFCVISSIKKKLKTQHKKLFDSLLLMSEGQLMYFGEAKNAMSYFETMGYSCPRGFNFADYLCKK